MELKEIVEQLESCNFECEGGPLHMNVAFIALKEMADSCVPSTTISVENFARNEAIKIKNILIKGENAIKALADGTKMTIYPTQANVKALETMIRYPAGLTEIVLWNELALVEEP